jgi:serine phosphatase RsbU (regulator of sigma subunit)
MFVGLVDLDADRLVYATASAPNLMVHRPGQAHFEALDGSGFALGVAVEARYANREVDFPQGAMLFHSSDALTDSGESGQALLDEVDLARVLDCNIAVDGPRQLIRAVAEASRYKDLLPLADDLTMIAMSRGARD